MYTINACGEFCAFWVNCAKLESRSLDCFGNTEAELGQSCAGHWALSSVRADIFCGA